MENLTNKELLFLIKSMNRYIKDEFTDEDTYAIEMYQNKKYIELKKYLDRFVECDKIINNLK
jgi:hypothetical protein